MSRKVDGGESVIGGSKLSNGEMGRGGGEWLVGMEGGCLDRGWEIGECGRKVGGRRCLW